MDITKVIGMDRKTTATGRDGSGKLMNVGSAEVDMSTVRREDGMRNTDTESLAVSEFVGRNRKIMRQTWKTALEYKKAVMWSAFIGISSLMWGYDALVRKTFLLV
jgi:hypothetical protein